MIPLTFWKSSSIFVSDFYNLRNYSGWMEEINSVLSGAYYIRATYHMSTDIRNRNSHLPVSGVLCKCYLSLNKLVSKKIEQSIFWCKRYMCANAANFLHLKHERKEVFSLLENVVFPTSSTEHWISTVR